MHLTIMVSMHQGIEALRIGIVEASMRRSAWLHHLEGAGSPLLAAVHMDFIESLCVASRVQMKDDQRAVITMS